MKRRFTNFLRLLGTVLFFPMVYVSALLDVWEEAQRQATLWEAQLTPDQRAAFQLCMEQPGVNTAQEYVEQMSTIVAQASIQQWKQFPFLRNHRLIMSVLTERKIITQFQRAFRLAAFSRAKEQEEE